MLFQSEGCTVSRRFCAIAVMPDLDSTMGPPGTPGSVKDYLGWVLARTCGVIVTKREEVWFALLVAVSSYSPLLPVIGFDLVIMFIYNYLSIFMGIFILQFE